MRGCACVVCWLKPFSLRLSRSCAQCTLELVLALSRAGKLLWDATVLRKVRSAAKGVQTAGGKKSKGIGKGAGSGMGKGVVSGKAGMLSPKRRSRRSWT